MDLTSCALCKQNSIPIHVFDFNLKDSIIKMQTKNNRLKEWKNVLIHNKSQIQ